MSDYSVVAENLTKMFGDFRAVDNISFKVKKGEIYGFLGANGAGKTTTIRMLCGLLEPTSGNASVAGFDIEKDTENVKRNLGYMSQKFALYNTLTVEENIDFYGGLYGLSKEKNAQRSNEVIEKVELGEVRKRMVSDIPGGIKQRVSLACAIIHEPKILFLDEPTAGVDPLLRRRFWDIIDELSSIGVTVFVTTHYMDEVEHCNRISLMNNGRIVKEGIIEDIKRETFKKPVYEIETDDVVKAYAKLSRKKSVIGEVSMHGAMLHLIPENIQGDAIATIKKIMDDAGVSYGHFSEVVPTMEDVFVRLVRD